MTLAVYLAEVAYRLGELPQGRTPHLYAFCAQRA